MPVDETPHPDDPAARRDWAAHDFSKLVHVRARFGAASVNGLIEPAQIAGIVQSIERGPVGSAPDPRQNARRTLLQGLINDDQLDVQKGEVLVSLAVWLLQTASPAALEAGARGLVYIFPDPLYKDGKKVQSETYRLVIARDIDMDELERTIRPR